MRLTIDGKSLWRNGLLGGIVLLGLASCAAPQGGQVHAPGGKAPSGRSGHEVSDSPVKLGRPYQVRGVTYTPADDRDYEDVGYASWYGEELAGNSTANGERFAPGGISAAHRTLPLPSYVEVTALGTGRTILVRINDRGPFDPGRLIDLSRGAAEQLGITGHGAAPVRVRRVEPPEQDRARLRSGERASARTTLSDRQLLPLRARLPERNGRISALRTKPDQGRTASAAFP